MNCANLCNQNDIDQLSVVVEGPMDMKILVFLLILCMLMV